MKKVILTIILAVISINSYAQPKAAGARLGLSGFEADYQHIFVKNQFLECSLGIDFGCLGAGNEGVRRNEKIGMKATGVYNFVWARPAWTNDGTWSLYAGPGVAIGYVHDDVHFKADDNINITHFQHQGFMLGLCAQVGLEYTFWFPLQISLNLRPIFGMHVNNRKPYDNPEKPGTKRYHEVHVGLYDNGFLGFAPSITACYRF